MRKNEVEEFGSYRDILYRSYKSDVYYSSNPIVYYYYYIKMCWLSLYMNFKDNFDTLLESTIDYAEQYAKSVKLISVVLVKISDAELIKGSCANIL